MLLTVSLPSSTPSSASSAEGLAPGRRLVDGGDVYSGEENRYRRQRLS